MHGPSCTINLPCIILDCAYHMLMVVYFLFYAWVYLLLLDRRWVRVECAGVLLPFGGSRWCFYFWFDRRALFSLPILHFALALYSSLVLRCCVWVSCPIHLYVQSKAIELSIYPNTVCLLFLLAVRVVGMSGCFQVVLSSRGLGKLSHSLLYLYMLLEISGLTLMLISKMK
jgi:hypothetical protein